jgi:hypothetical protein
MVYPGFLKHKNARHMASAYCHTALIQIEIPVLCKTANSVNGRTKKTITE